MGSRTIEQYTVLMNEPRDTGHLFYKQDAGELKSCVNAQRLGFGYKILLFKNTRYAKLLLLQYSPFYHVCMGIWKREVLMIH